jgi:hypothetical protein
VALEEFLGPPLPTRLARVTTREASWDVGPAGHESRARSHFPAHAAAGRVGEAPKLLDHHDPVATSIARAILRILLSCLTSPAIIADSI